MKTKIFFIALFVYSVNSLFSQQKLAHAPSDFDLFAEERMLKVILTYDVKLLLKNRYKDEYQPAIMLIYLNDSSYIEKEIRIKPRGEFRRQYCYYPPLKLNFKKTDFENESMSQISSLKLVSKCRGSDVYQQYVLKEYLVYKAYNQLTDLSFKTRLLEVTTIDQRGKRKPQTSYGFVIEDVDVLAERNNSIEFEIKRMPPSSTNSKQAAIVDIFQFMIGNTDYQVWNLHNIKLLKSKDPLDFNPYTVPYDFDYSGLVNASYAIPAESLGIENVRQRLFRGSCQTPEIYQEVFNLFREKEKDILSIYEEDELLDKHNRKASISYLKEFYQIINTEAMLNRQILEMCNNR